MPRHNRRALYLMRATSLCWEAFGHAGLTNRPDKVQAVPVKVKRVRTKGQRKAAHDRLEHVRSTGIHADMRPRNVYSTKVKKGLASSWGSKD